MPASIATASAAPAKLGTQARLILQDPLAFDQASQPLLRSSWEILAEPQASMEREKARELWESLSLEPEIAQAKLVERKRLLSRVEQLASETKEAKTQTAALKLELERSHDERLNHPVVYAGAAGLLGLGALWWLERRKHMQLRERELEALAQQSPSLSDDAPQSYLQMPEANFSLEDSPDLAADFATDLSALPERRVSANNGNDLNLSNDLSKPDANLVDTPEWAQPKSNLPSDEIAAAPTHLTQDRSFLAISKRVLGNLLRRRSPRDALPPAQLTTDINATTNQPTTSPLSLTQSDQHDDASQLLYDEEALLAFEQELLAQKLNAQLHAGYQSDQANIELLSQTRITPQRGESAMEHLLELRTAVNGFCAIGRAEGAAKLLQEHVAADPSTCAWAYLEYMQLCEKLDQRTDFESMRKRYRQQFNRMAPYWHEPNSNVLGLDGYARAVSELCTVWAQGIHAARSALASWLVGPLLGRKLLQLPAYYDLFDLYELLEYADAPADSASAISLLDAKDAEHDAQRHTLLVQADAAHDFVPTVSLLDLDYEFSSDVILQEREVAQSETAVTIVKPGNFSVDFNVAGTQLGGLHFAPAELEKK